MVLRVQPATAHFDVECRMTDQDNQPRPPRKRLSVALLVIVFMIVFYAVSFGPLVFFTARFGHYHPVVRVIYHPHMVLVYHSEAYWSYVVFWARIGGEHISTHANYRAFFEEEHQ